MLSPGDNKPGEDRSSADTLFRTLCRLVPDSGIQFLDMAIPRQALETTERAFIEDAVVIDGETVWALAPLGGSSPQPSRPVVRIAARSFIQNVCDRWIPLPYLRFISRDGSGRARFDAGPTNWARLYISSRPGNDPDHFAAVIAFDTRTEQQSRLDIDAYVMPTADDVRFGSTFAVTDDAEELAEYLAEPWVQDWIKAVFPGAARTLTEGAPQSLGLHQIAGYLTLLTVLRRTASAPSLQFFDTTQEAAAPQPVDVVLDIGTSRSAALIVENRDGRPLLSEARLLPLRALGDPTVTYRGAFESRIAFARAQFGNEVLSRRSGRPDAFAWPSLARTGPEAAALAGRSQQSDGAVGVAAPKAHLRDIVPRRDAWRFAADGRSGARRGQMISGNLLVHAVPTAGLLPAPSSHAVSTALRPQHALTAMASFLIAELLQQVTSVINAPVTAGTSADFGDAVRHIRQLILPVPLTMPREDRDTLRARADAAVDMIWQSLGWDAPVGAATSQYLPPKPVVRLGLDETLAAQLVYLYDEIGQRMRGEARALLDHMGKSRPEFGVQPCLRLGAIDIGGGHATMTIVTYASSGEAPIVPNLLGAQRSGIAGNALLDGIAAALIVPALARAIAAKGGESAQAFLEDLLAAGATDATFEPTSVGVRLTEFWLRPAALALLDLSDGLCAHAGNQDLSLRLGDLVAARGPRNHAVGDELNVAIEAIRAAPIDLAAVPVVVRLSAVAAASRAVLEPMLTSLARALVASDCDGVLLTGWPSRLGIVRQILLEQMPWRPDRILSLADHPWQPWYPMTDADRAAASGKDIALVGALMALAGGERLGFGSGGAFGFGDGGLAADAGATEASDGWRSAAAAHQGGGS